MTLDVAWLGRWIRPAHLEPRAIAAARADLCESPVGATVLRDFLQPSVAERLAHLFERDGVFQTSYGLYADDHASFDDWSAAPDSARFYRYQKLVGVRPAAMLSDETATYLKFRSAIADPRFAAYFGALLNRGIGRIDGLYGRAMTRDDYLRVHTDAVLDRLLAWTLYLSKGWRAEMGGGLRFRGSGGAEVRLTPEFNCLALFDVTRKTSHLVELIAEVAGDRLRFSVGGWFRAPTA